MQVTSSAIAVCHCRTLLVLHISCDGAKAICKDGRVITLSYDGCELRDLMLTQVLCTVFISVVCVYLTSVAVHFVRV